jgi:hypothetical protein
MDLFDFSVMSIARPDFFVLDFSEDILGRFFDDHNCIGAVKSIVFVAVNGVWRLSNITKNTLAVLVFQISVWYRMNSLGYK